MQLVVTLLLPSTSTENNRVFRGDEEITAQLCNALVLEVFFAAGAFIKLNLTKTEVPCFAAT